MKLGEIIKSYRTRSKLTMREFAQRCGVSHSYIAMLEGDKNSKTGAPITPSLITLKKIADGLGVTVDALIKEADDMPVKISEATIDLLRPIAKKKLPMLGNVACGEPIFAEEHHETYVVADENMHADFCLTAKGDSMINARIFEGDILFIRSQPTVENGEIAVVLIDNEATVKRIYFDNENKILTLSPENPLYKPTRFQGADLERIRILGKVLSGKYNIE